MNTFQLRIDKRHVAQSTDGQRLYLKATDGYGLGVGSRHTEDNEHQVGSLYAIPMSLSYYGVHVPEEQKFTAAAKLINERLDPILDQAKAEPDRPFVAKLANGAVHIRWNPVTEHERGDWTVVWPNVARHSPDEPPTTTEICHALHLAVPKFIERTLMSMNVTFDYGLLDGAMLLLVDVLTHDPQIIFPEDN